MVVRVDRNSQVSQRTRVICKNIQMVHLTIVREWFNLLFKLVDCFWNDISWDW